MYATNARDLSTLRNDVNNGISDVERTWGAALEQRREMNDLNNGMQQFDEMSQLADRAKIRNLQRRNNQQATLASAMARSLMSDGGRLGQDEIGYMNRQMQDGSTTGNSVRDVGYYGDGSNDFGIVVEIPGKNGQPSQFREQRISPREQLALAVNFPGMFGEGGITKLRERLKGGKQPLTDREIADIESRGMNEYKRGVDEINTLQNNISLYGKGSMSLSDRMALDTHRAILRQQYGGRGSSSSSGSANGKFSQDQVQYFINKQRELESAKTSLDPRKAEDKKRMDEIDAEMAYLKAGERLAAIQGLDMTGFGSSATQQKVNAKGITGEDVVEKYSVEKSSSDKSVQDGERKNPFGGEKKDDLKADEDKTVKSNEADEDKTVKSNENELSAIPRKQTDSNSTKQKVSGRFKHEGYTSDFSKSLKASNDAATKDDDLRKKRLEELRRMSNEDRVRFMSGNKGKAFRFSEQEEVDELMNPINKAEDVIKKYSDMRSAKNESDARSAKLNAEIESLMGKSRRGKRR